MACVAVVGNVTSTSVTFPSARWWVVGPSSSKSWSISRFSVRQTPVNCVTPFSAARRASR